MILDTSMSINRPSVSPLLESWKITGLQPIQLLLVPGRFFWRAFSTAKWWMLERASLTEIFMCGVCPKNALFLPLCKAKTAHSLLNGFAHHGFSATDGIVCRFQFWGHPESFPYLGEFQRYSATFCHTAKHSSVYSGVLHKRQQISKIQGSLYSPKRLQNPFGPSCF